MRNPIRSETDAFYILFGGALLLAASFAVAALVTPIAGGAVFATGVLAALAWEFATKDPERRRPLREAALAGSRGDAHGRPLVLIVANRTLGDPELRRVMRDRVDGGADLRILAPILVSRVRYVASDVDRELAQAHERLDETLAWAEAEGIPASGAVGDPLAAFGAVEDELRLRSPTEVIVSSLPRGRSNWLEAGILEQLREELEIPVTHVVATAELVALAPRA